MTLPFERDFRVRHYECDTYGHLNNAQYLHYMEQAAFEASAAAGYDRARYRDMGRSWLIRETEIEYLTPVEYDQTVTVRTWVVDFRRFRSLRAYEFWLGDGLAARARTDWVFLETATGRPARIPPGLARAYLAPGDRPTTPRRKAFSPAPPPPPGAFTLRRRVEWRDVDPVGHVNNAVYLAYAEDCGVQVAAAHGWPMARWHATGFGVVSRRHRLQYRQPARLDDTLELTTWISDVKRSSALRHYTIRRVPDGALLARAETLWVWVDLETRRVIRIPAEFIAAFAANISPANPSSVGG